jgi:hypothetical protein
MTPLRTALLVAVVAAFAVSTGKPEGGNPIVRHATERFTERGEVLERLNAGSYRYLRLRTEAGPEVWVATLAATAPTADRIEVVVFARARDFKSARLGRSFSELWFGAARAQSVVPPAVKGSTP